MTGIRKHEEKYPFYFFLRLLLLLLYSYSKMALERKDGMVGRTEYVSTSTSFYSIPFLSLNTVHTRRRSLLTSVQYRS